MPAQFDDAADVLVGDSEPPVRRLRLIDERLADDPSAPPLGELADLCDLSVRQLTRGFKVSRACSIVRPSRERDFTGMLMRATPE